MIEQKQEAQRHGVAATDVPRGRRMGTSSKTETTITDDSETEEDENIGDASSIARNRREEISNTEDLWKTLFQIKLFYQAVLYSLPIPNFKLYVLSQAS